MCRLLGSSVAEPADVRADWLDAFARLADTGIVSPGSPPGHRDGWGVAGMVDGHPAILARRTGSINTDADALAAVRRALDVRRPEPVIAHLRKASPGLAVSLANTHPFLIGDALFCHNGSIRDAAALPVGDPAVMAGTTDSERWLAFLLEHAGAAVGEAFTGALADAIRASRALSAATAWNFLLTRGPCLFIYRDAHGRDPGVHTLHLSTAPGRVLCCSEPLAGGPTGAPWEPLANRELVVVERGAVTGRQIV